MVSLKKALVCWPFWFHEISVKLSRDSLLTQSHTLLCFVRELYPLMVLGSSPKKEHQIFQSALSRGSVVHSSEAYVTPRSLSAKLAVTTHSCHGVTQGAAGLVLNTGICSPSE